MTNERTSTDRLADATSLLALLDVYKLLLEHTLNEELLGEINSKRNPRGAFISEEHAHAHRKACDTIYGFMFHSAGVATVASVEAAVQAFTEKVLNDVDIKPFPEEKNA